jgi:short subunit dehydrogenase-like uncharacterized protein
VSWGDVSTAFHSTGIPNVRVWMALSPARARLVRTAVVAAPLLGLPPVKRVLRGAIRRFVRGPSAELLAAGRHRIRARAWSERTGEEAVVELETPDGYAITADGAVTAVQALLASPPTGFLTPSRAFGAGFVDRLRGVRWLGAAEPST